MVGQVSVLVRIGSWSEGQIVEVPIVELLAAGGLTVAGRGRAAGSADGGCGTLVGLVADAALEVRDLVRNELGGVALLAGLVLPLTGLEPAFDVDLVALAQVFRGALSLLAPDDDAEPLGLFLPLPRLVLVVPVDGDGELG